MSYVSASSNGKNSTSVLYVADDGSKLIRQGGSRAWRNNNPGNMRHTKFSRYHGAIGSAGGFAVFPDRQTGRAALSALLQVPSYASLSIFSAISKYAPPQENDTDKYQKQIGKLTGLDIKRKLGDLKNNEIESVVNAIQIIESYVVGTEKSVRKIIGAQTDGKRLTAFLIEGDSAYIPVSTAIRLAGHGEIDAVIVRPSRGEAYLRATADAATKNNFSAIATPA